jgi:hypothetical protein
VQHHDAGAAAARGHDHVDKRYQNGKLNVPVEEAAVEPPLKVCHRRTRMRVVGDTGEDRTTYDRNR